MYIYGKNTLKEAMKKNEKIDKIYLQENFRDENLKLMIQKSRIDVEYMSKIQLDRLANGNHQGIIGLVNDFEYEDIEELMKKEFLVLLDHLEDPHNLGAIIRTSEAAGIDGIILPKNRSVEVNDTVMKTSVGALYNVPICQVTNLNQTIKKLKQFGFWIIGTDMDGEDYTKIDYPDKCVLIIGSEGFGISRLVKESCDFVARIPMNGKINSLNASVAAGIMIYELIRK